MLSEAEVTEQHQIKSESQPESDELLLSPEQRLESTDTGNSQTGLTIPDKLFGELESANTPL